MYTIFVFAIKVKVYFLIFIIATLPQKNVFPKKQCYFTQNEVWWGAKQHKSIEILIFFSTSIVLPKCTTLQFLEFHTDPKNKDKPHNEISALTYLFLTHCDENSVPFPTKKKELARLRFSGNKKVHF